MIFPIFAKGFLDIRKIESRIWVKTAVGKVFNDFSFYFKPDSKKEQGHQTVIDEMLERTVIGERAECKGDVEMEQVLIHLVKPGVG